MKFLGGRGSFYPTTECKVTDLGRRKSTEDRNFYRFRGECPRVNDSEIWKTDIVTTEECNGKKLTTVYIKTGQRKFVCER